MTTKKQLRADIQALTQDVEYLVTERDMLKARLHSLREKHANEIYRKDAAIRALSGLIHYQRDGEPAEAMAIVGGER